MKVRKSYGFLLFCLSWYANCFAQRQVWSVPNIGLWTKSCETDIYGAQLRISKIEGNIITLQVTSCDVLPAVIAGIVSSNNLKRESYKPFVINDKKIIAFECQISIDSLFPKGSPNNPISIVGYVFDPAKGFFKHTDSIQIGVMDSIFDVSSNEYKIYLADEVFQLDTDIQVGLSRRILSGAAYKESVDSFSYECIMTMYKNERLINTVSIAPSIDIICRFEESETAKASFPNNTCKSIQSFPFKKEIKFCINLSSMTKEYHPRKGMYFEANIVFAYQEHSLMVRALSYRVDSASLQSSFKSSSLLSRLNTPLNTPSNYPQKQPMSTPKLLSSHPVSLTESQYKEAIQNYEGNGPLSKQELKRTRNERKRLNRNRKVIFRKKLTVSSALNTSGTNDTLRDISYFLLDVYHLKKNVDRIELSTINDLSKALNRILDKQINTTLNDTITANRYHKIIHSLMIRIHEFQRREALESSLFSNQHFDYLASAEPSIPQLSISDTFVNNEFFASVKAQKLKNGKWEDLFHYRVSYVAEGLEDDESALRRSLSSPTTPSVGRIAIGDYVIWLTDPETRKRVSDKDYLSVRIANTRKNPAENFLSYKENCQP